MARPALRLVVWDGMPDRAALEAAGSRVGRELEVTVISSNEDLERLMASEPPYDLVCPSDYLVEKLVAGNGLADISGALSDRWEALDDWARSPAYDPGESHCLPLAFGTTGLLRSDDRALGVDSWSDFFDPPGGTRVGLLDEVREVVGAALLANGMSPNDYSARSLREVSSLLDGQEPSVVSVSSDDFTGPVAENRADVHHAWSGPASVVVRRNPDLSFVLPDEGALLWVTTGAVPADAPDPEAAIRLLHELTDPALGIMAVLKGGYSTPSRSIRGALPEKLVRDRVLFPDPELIARCQTLVALEPEAEASLTEFQARLEALGERSVDSRS